MNLLSAPAGRIVRVLRCDHPDYSLRHRLMELGLTEGAVIHVLGGQDPVICQVNGCRMGLSREVAASILVCDAPGNTGDERAWLSAAPRRGR